MSKYVFGDIWWRDDEKDAEDVSSNYKIIAQLNGENLSYEFNDIRVVKNIKNNKFYYIHDSGCSCPTPFERTTEEMLTEFRTVDELDNFVTKHNHDQDYPRHAKLYSLDQRMNFYRTVREAMYGE